MTTSKETVLKIRTVLASLLSSMLGKYILPNNQEVPSIAVRTLSYNNTNVPTNKIKPNSGIECVIEPQADTDYRKTKFSAVNLVRHYTVTLDQHDGNKSLDDALELIYSHPGISPLIQPIVRGRIQLPNQQGEAPARAVLEITTTERSDSIY